MKSDTEELIESGWRVLGASLCGVSHIKTGKPCQDAHAWRMLPNGVLVAAVADGAGSAALAEVGAEIAARTAVETLHMYELSLGPHAASDAAAAWKDALALALFAARSAVESEAVARDVKARDLATTLIVVVATPDLAAAAQIGDGAAVIADAEGNIMPLTAPSSGEYLNETTFLVSPNALETAQIVTWTGKPARIGVLSDGLQMLALKMPEGVPFPPFFKPLFQFVSEPGDDAAAQTELEAFLGSATVTGRTDDDITLLLAAYRDESER